MFVFSQEFIDELLNFMTCPAMIKVLDSSSAQVSESSFPKSLTFQRTLFIELSTEPLAVQSCPLIYEAFYDQLDQESIVKLASISLHFSYET